MISPLSTLRRASRRLRDEPGFLATALLTLGLCVGANLAIFAVVDAILLKKLPFPEGDRLVIARKDYPGASIWNGASSIPNYFDWKESLKAFESVSAIQEDGAVVGGAVDPKRVPCAYATADFASTLGVRPALGRFFDDEEMLSGKQVVVLTDAYWKANFGASPSILGRTIEIDSRPYSVIGVLPRDFRYLSSHAELYLPLRIRDRDRTPHMRHTGNVEVIARLKDGETLASAEAQVRALDAKQLADDPFAAQLKSIGYKASLRPLHADHVRSVRPILLLLQGGGLTLLLIGCVNLVNLLFVRASKRSGEFAVRRALGAGEGDVAMEVLLETLLVAGLGGLAGLAFGALGIRLLSAFGTAELPLGAAMRLDGRTVLAALAASLSLGLLLSLPLIWYNLRRSLPGALRSETRSGTADRKALGLRHGFVVGQIALAFVLVVCAGLLSLSLKRVLAQRPGFEPERVLSGQLSIPEARYKRDVDRVAFSERLLETLKRQPGVSEAALATSAPFVPFASTYKDHSVVTVEGDEKSSAGSLRAHLCCWVSGDYWAALGAPMLEGRPLDERDQALNPRVCVVDEAFAKQRWPDGKALGRRLLKDAEFRPAEAYTVVGVVGHLKQEDLGETDQGVVYFPYRSNADRSVTVLVRTALAPESVAAALRNAVRSVDPEIPVDDVRPLSARIETSLVQRRVPALLSGAFASVALALAVLGTYGVIAYSAVQRRREIGVRIALGARPVQVLGLFLGLGSRLLLVGLLAGIPGAALLSDAMRKLVFGSVGFDLGLTAATAGALALSTLLAAWLPARRVARLNPVEALRSE